MTAQPRWRCIAQLGDANPLDYGGFFVLVDDTGVYPPEVERVEPTDSDDEDSALTVHRFILEPCTYIDGVLSDNRFHPESPAWFANPDSKRDGVDPLACLASHVGRSIDDLRADFLSDDPVRRAEAWRTVGDYYGWENLDSYPLTLTRSEAKQRYRKAMYRVPAWP